MADIPKPPLSHRQSSNAEKANIFDMGTLIMQLPQNRRGLSRCYSGRSRSFTCMGDVKSVEDLKKPEIPEAKRKKYSSRKDMCLPPLSCRRVVSSNHFTPCIGV